jgi:hypothetical protein
MGGRLGKSPFILVYKKKLILTDIDEKVPNCFDERLSNVNGSHI